MVAYSFKKQFVEPILLGTKRHTIRAPKKGRARHARPGDQLQLYTGMRTRQCKLIAKAPCESVYEVLLCWDTDTIFVVDTSPDEHGKARYHSRSMSAAEAEKFARDDGFASLAAMKAFWTKTHPGVPVFKGVVICWPPLISAGHA